MSKLYVLAACSLALAVSPLRAQSPNSKSKLNILNGPATAHLESIAQIDLPVGYIFVDGKSTRALMKAEGEPVSGNELGLLKATNGHWSVMFEFSGVGYVKDDEKDKLDADKLLASIKRGTAEANKERVRNGNPPLEVIGWEQPPRYDETTHNLEWAIRGASEGRQILNYNTRLLGRKGRAGRAGRGRRGSGRGQAGLVYLAAGVHEEGMEADGSGLRGRGGVFQKAFRKDYRSPKRIRNGLGPAGTRNLFRFTSQIALKLANSMAPLRKTMKRNKFRAPLPRRSQFCGFVNVPQPRLA